MPSKPFKGSKKNDLKENQKYEKFEKKSRNIQDHAMKHPRQSGRGRGK